MKRWVGLLFVLACAVSRPGTTGSRPGATQPIRALLVVGGCCHDYAHQKDILTQGISRRANVEWTIAYDPDTTTRHLNPVYDNPDWAKGFDVVVHDECSSDVKDKAVIDTILKPHRDGLPGVVLHCGMHCYRSEGWNRKVATPWFQFTGLNSTGHGPQQPIAVTYLDRDSPITKPLATGRPSTKNSTTTPPASSSPPPRARPRQAGPRRDDRRLDQHLQRQDQGLRHDPRPQQRNRRRPPLPRPGHPRPALGRRQARRPLREGPDPGGPESTSSTRSRAGRHRAMTGLNELHRFRTEAATLLGLDPPQTGPVPGMAREPPWA